MEKMETALVVASAFAGHAKGALITDAATVASILASPQAVHVRRIAIEPTAAEGAQA